MKRAVSKADARARQHYLAGALYRIVAREDFVEDFQSEVIQDSRGNYKPEFRVVHSSGLTLRVKVEIEKR